MLEEREAFHIKVIKNQNTSNPSELSFLTMKNTESVRHLHQSIPAYMTTPLVKLESLAKRLGVKGIYIKDESHRFGLKAFKGLGGIYALSKLICKELGLDINKISFSDLQRPDIKAQISDMVFVTATDGNHGKGIAWAAGQLGCQAYVYMPKGSSEMRAQAIRDAGRAHVSITDMNYDDTVRFASKMHEERGWYLVQDTSWDGYEEIPSWIIQGYTTMAYEAVQQLKQDGITEPTHVFLQAGVGAMAGGVLGFLKNYYEDDCPTALIVEPDNVACIFESAKHQDGKPHAAQGSGVTIMAGLNCGEPCTITWPVLRDCAKYYFACPDFVAARGMRILASSENVEEKVISGESGAVTLGLLTLLLEQQELEEIKKELKLDENSVILLFNTEGDTDPEIYRSIIIDGYYPTLSE